MATIPFRISPMLARVADAPFSRPNWIFEEKYDGVRLVAYKEGPKVTLVSRNAIDRTARYPEIVAAIQKLKPATLVLDGEVVVFDPHKISRFQLLQQGKGQPRYVVFDCLYADGKDLRKEPLSIRRATLERYVKTSPAILLSSRLAGDGSKAFQIASRRGLEGLIAKNSGSAYFEGRSAQWLKIKVHQEDEFVIGGYTAPGGTRRHFGALLLGAYVREQLLFVGKVGTGFDERMLGSLYRQMQPLVQRKSPFVNDPRERGTTFVAPKLVAQISYTEWTDDGKLRNPVYLGLRDDKAAKEVVLSEG